MSGIHPPFNIGQIVEAKSFEKGYRGAWFRCKVTDIITKNNELFYRLEYLDYPGEKIHTTKLHQKRVAKDKKHLMLRPKFPAVYHQSEVDIKDVMETTLVVYDTWKVGDLVDWWKDDCYWSGTIVEVKGDGYVKVELFPWPIGEGECYDASCSDIRPSLDWSLKNGWAAPFSKDGEKRQCAKLIKPTNEASDQVIDRDDGREEENIGTTTKKQKGDGDLPLNITTSNSIEAAFSDLEELVTRIKWLKGFLASNSDKSANATKFSWEFVEYRQTSTTRL